MIIKMDIHKSYSKIHTSKHLSDTYSIQNGLKQDAFQLWFRITTRKPPTGLE